MVKAKLSSSHVRVQCTVEDHNITQLSKKLPTVPNPAFSMTNLRSN